MSSPSSHTNRPASSPATPGLERIEQLVRSLGGVISVRAVPDDEGEVETLHVLAADSVGREELVREIESALLTYFDVALERDQTSVVISHDPSFLDGGTSSGAAGEASGPTRSDNGVGATGRERDRPWPEPPSGAPEGVAPSRRRFDSDSAPSAPFENTARRQEHHPADRERRAGGRSSRLDPAASGSEVPGDAPRRLRMVRYTAEGDDGPGVEIRVTVEAPSGERYDGVAHAERLDGLEPLHFAEAAAHAAEVAVRSTGGRSEESPITALRVEGVERLELFGRPYVAVSIAMRGRSGGRSATGFHPVAEGPCRDVTQAVLDAVDRGLEEGARRP